MSTLKSKLITTPNHNTFKRQILNYSITIIVFELITFIIPLVKTAYTIKKFKEQTDKIMMAPSFVDAIVTLRLFALVVIISFTILPAVLFYQYFVGSKSIYTMLRLPGEYSRLQFYFNQIKSSIKGMISFWFVQLLIILIFYLLYILAIPKESIAPGGWNNLWKSMAIYKIYPFTKAIYFIPVVFMPFLLSNTSILVALIERTRTRSFPAVFATIISGLGFYTYYIDYSHSVWIVPLVTLISVAISIYYIYRVQLV